MGCGAGVRGEVLVKEMILFVILELSLFFFLIFWVEIDFIDLRKIEESSNKKKEIVLKLFF